MKILCTLALCLCAIGLGAHTTDDDDDRAEVTFIVSMKCKNCQERIEETLAFATGVKGMKVDLEKKTVTITYQPSKTSADELKKTIQKLGYTVAQKKTPGTSSQDNQS